MLDKQQRKKIKRKILSFVLPPIFFLFMRVIYLTCKVEFKIEASKEALAGQFIFAFWHGELFLQPFAYNKVKPKGKIKTIISHHFDGNIIARTIYFFGFGTIRGSSTSGAVGVLKSSLKNINAGYDIAITPDGPKGPYRSVASGIIALSQKKDLNIIASNFSASKYWQLKSWDKFIIPKPFAKVTIHIKKELKVSALDMDEAKIKVQKVLNS